MDYVDALGSHVLESGGVPAANLSIFCTGRIFNEWTARSRIVFVGRTMASVSIASGLLHTAIDVICGWAGVLKEEVAGSGTELGAVIRGTCLVGTKIRGSATLGIIPPGAKCLCPNAALGLTRDEWATIFIQGLHWALLFCSCADPTGVTSSCSECRTAVLSDTTLNWAGIVASRLRVHKW